MALTKTRRRTLEILKTHGIPDSISLSALQKLVEDYRGQPIGYVLDPSLNDNPKVHGLWNGSRTEGFDRISIPESCRESGRLATVAHEFGHMLTVVPGEEIPYGDQTEIVDALAEVIPVGRRIEYQYKDSTDYSTEEERLAEMLGIELAVRVLRWERAHADRTYQFDRVFG